MAKLDSTIIYGNLVVTQDIIGNGHTTLNTATANGTLNAFGQFFFESNSNSNYTEGIRLNQSSTGWAGAVIGGTRGSVNGITDAWFVARNTSSDFIIGTSSTVDSGLFLPRTGNDIQYKGLSLFHDSYHPNADKWTTSRTLTLTGDVTGAIAVDGSANVSLVTTVGNDSHTHDGRYYTETESNAKYLLNTTDSLAGTLSITTGLNIGSVNMTEAAERAGCLRVKDATTSWSGVVLGNNTEDAWSLMFDGNGGGFYNDTTNEWHIMMTDNGDVDLYHNNSVKLSTTSTGVSVVGTMSATTVTGANVTSGSNPGHTHTYDKCGAMRVLGRVVTDCNHADFRVPGSYGFSNLPANGTGEAYGAMLVAANIDTGLQIAGGYNNDDLYFRGWAGSGSTYYAWRRLLHAGNYNSYAPSLTGVGASGSWGISITGNAATASQLYISNDDTGDTNCPILFTATTTAGYKSVYEDSAVYIDNTANTLHCTNLYATAQVAGDYMYSHTPIAGSWGHTSHGGLLMTATSSVSAYNVIRVNQTDGFKIQTLGGTAGTQRWYTGSSYITFSGTTITATLSGNATTATKLASISTSFAGTYPMVVNVSGTLYSHTGFTFDGTNQRINTTQLQIGTASGYFGGDANYTTFTGGNFYIQSGTPIYYNYATTSYHGAASGDAQKFRGNTLDGDDWNINGSTGNFTTTGTMYALDFEINSDKSLKENISHYKPRKMGVDYVSYNFIDSETKKPRVGVIAQQVQENYPELVSKSDEGKLRVSYIDLHSMEIAWLKHDNKELHKKIDKLNNILKKHNIQ